MSPVWLLLTLLPVLGGAARFNCKGRILGAYYADAKSGCKAFHVCVRVAGGGIRDFRFFCPPGTLFHQEAQTCTDWGDDDPLACPADIYDGQFDVYKIGSGFDTKKLSSNGNRDDEVEFGLQRAETGDRRLSQNNVNPNRPDTDLRAAHSSDFFSGQRDRGRDEASLAAQSSSPAPSSSSSQPQLYSRQSYRRSSTQRTFSTTQNTTPVPSPSPLPPQYESNSKRKLIRKRPIYVSAKSTTTLAPNTPPQENYPQSIKQTQQSTTSTQTFNDQQSFNHNFNNHPNFDRHGLPQTRQPPTTTPDVPPQYREYKDEYVEVSRVTPKQSRYFASSSSSTFIPQPTNAQRYNNKKEGLVELFNYDAQSTPELKAQNDNESFKARNSFNAPDTSRNLDYARSKNFIFNNARESPTTIDYSVTTRGFSSSTPIYKNYNSVSYESEKNNFVPYSKQNNFNNYPTSTIGSTSTFYTTARPDTPLNLNTVAYNTNIGFDAQNNNYADSSEDDGQYHPPGDEDDGQYKPEIYDRELLAGAHSLNIAASGNRLPEDRKTFSKTKSSSKNAGQTAAPRPFRPSPTTVQPTTRATEVIYTTTFPPHIVSTQRTFDYIQTYTTTSRPVDFLEIAQTFTPVNDEPAKPTTTVASKVIETRPPRPTSRTLVSPTQPQTTPPRPTTRPPNFAYPVKSKEDNSYDYAYYDSDPGFVEYDHIEEFGKTNKKRS